MIGARYRDLARHDPAQAPRAVRYIGQALTLRDATRQRNRAFDLIGLARVHLLTGEPEQAAALIGQAIPLASKRAPGRVGRKLGDLTTRPPDGPPYPRYEMPGSCYVR